MLEQVEKLLEEMDDEAGKLITADEAEDALVERMHEMTREALESWARKREGKLNAQAPSGAAMCARCCASIGNGAGHRVCRAPWRGAPWPGAGRICFG